MAAEDGLILPKICESFDRVIEKAQGTAVQEVVGLAVLFEIARKRDGPKPKRPFNARMEADTFDRYKKGWKKLLSIYRTCDMDVDQRPGHKRLRWRVQRGRSGRASVPLLG